MFYTNSIILPKKGLQNLYEFLEKIEVQMKEKNFSEKEILESKLAPDMFDFGLQIKITIEQALEIAETFSERKSNIAMNHEENYSIFEYKNFIKNSIDFLEKTSKEEIKNPEEKEVRFFWIPGGKVVGSEYLLNYAIPNFYFHLTTAYDIMRNKGFDIGKSDFLGSNFDKVIREDK